ncbi:hypothetical protein HYPSUDRAFT_811264 [Hypholoma sublateritium FD-334 SS-4]|uniref:Uncharacterized protein n=1 Tax=Hypholoma sublateritium (strain FD-334 SS-4) TaxID=945553 RepID=A0A0D2Q9D6_HYPSF|nr:hypothetical protein HYPSUDRAFT_811264 [Hypholoma sublateritium FD-334 SS-4]
MPKRPKSPEAADDARYFTVYKPYPLNPNWAEEEDQKACAVWIAECIGPHHLWAIHEKPKSRNMMLLEVSKDFEDHASLLGEHRWSEFLKDPADDEKGRTTQVFHSFYARGRDAQKDGWKVIVVQSKWFDDWAPGKDRIKYPYPNTHWCPTPVEDKTNKTLCRPLPAETKAPPPRAQSTVVGSSTWVAKQTEPAPTKAALASAWSGGSAQMAQVIEQAPSASSSSSPSIHPRSPISSGASTPVLPGPKGKVAWGRSVPLQKFVSDAVRANSRKTGWTAVQPAAPAGAKSPLAEEAPKGPVNAWAKPLKVPASQRSKPAPTPAPKIDSQWGSTEADYGAWQVDAAAKDGANRNTSTPDTPITSTWGGTPASPRKGRTQDRKERRDQPASSSHKDHGSDHQNGSLSRRESASNAPFGRDKRDKSSSRACSDRDKRDGSSSRARSDRRQPDESFKVPSNRDRHDVVDFITPQHEKRRGWDVPSPEQSYKHTPKPWDKKKKEKETIETMMFGPAEEWDAAPLSKMPDVKAANGSSRTLCRR